MDGRNCKNRPVTVLRVPRFPPARPREGPVSVSVSSFVCVFFLTLSFRCGVCISSLVMGVLIGELLKLYYTKVDLYCFTTICFPLSDSFIHKLP